MNQTILDKVANQMLDDLLLNDANEFSMITGIPVHELLGITKEQLKEWLDKRESERKTYENCISKF